MKIVSPGLRSGAVIDFFTKRLRAYTGTIAYVVNQKPMAAEFFEVHTAVGDKPMVFMTGRGGEFYLDDLPPGTYRALMTKADMQCSFDLRIPVSDEAFTALPPIVCTASR